MSMERCASDRGMSSMYGDEEIDSALAKIDAALPKCYPDHLDDAEAIGELSHQAVNSLRKFREEVLAKTEEALGERDATFLEPGDGPMALQEALGRVLSYTVAKSRVAVELERCDRMLHLGTVRAPARRELPAGRPLTYLELSKELTVAVRLHVERVVDAAEARLEAASRYHGTRDVQRWGIVALWVLQAIKRVDKSMTLGHQAMTSFEGRLEGKDRAIRIEEEVKEGNRDGRRERGELGARIKTILDRTGFLVQQIDDVLKQLSAVRIDQAEGKCPRGFFLVPADKTKWSWTKQADLFSLYTKNVQLFFVCRMFFVELKAAAARSKAEGNALVALRSERQFDHEFSDPIPLELPRSVVAKRLHAIRLSVKIVKILVDAASLGLSLGSFIPNLSSKDQDDLLGVVQTHLAAAELATGGEIGQDLNLRKWSSRRLRKFLKLWREPTTPGNTRSLAEAHQVLQGYLDQKHPGVWQDAIRGKLVATPNLHGTDCAYVCTKTETHIRSWRGTPSSAPVW